MVEVGRLSTFLKAFKSGLLLFSFGNFATFIVRFCVRHRKTGFIVAWILFRIYLAASYIFLFQYLFPPQLGVMSFQLSSDIVVLPDRDICSSVKSSAEAIYHDHSSVDK
jgi:hypothetical protein